MRILFYLFSLLILGSSYALSDPVVDPASIKNEEKLYRDRAECRSIAKDNTNKWGSAAKDTVIGAGVGAGTGALIGVISGSAGKGAGIGAVVGGVGGGGRAVYKSNKDFDTLYRNCIRNRGYRVLN